MNRLTGILMLVALMLCSCNRGGTRYHHFEPILSDEWSFNDTVHFQLPTAVDDGLYERYVGLRTTHRFPYTGLWVILKTQCYNPEKLQFDTVYIHTLQNDDIDTRSGGGMPQTETAITPLSLVAGQRAEVSVYHHMTRQHIPGISDVGLRLAHKR